MIVGSSEENELIGYVVSRRDPAQPVGKLRSFLREKVPEYMFPSLFVSLDALPLTPNGKVNRDALPPPDANKLTIDKGIIEPRGKLEELVAQVWREVLKIDKIISATTSSNSADVASWLLGSVSLIRGALCQEVPGSTAVRCANGGKV